MYLPTPPHESGDLDIPWPLCVDLITRRLNLDGTTTLNALRKATCLSMPIVETIFRHLLARLASFEPAGPVERLSSAANAGLKHLPLRYRLD